MNESEDQSKIKENDDVVKSDEQNEGIDLSKKERLFVLLSVVFSFCLYLSVVFNWFTYGWEAKANVSVTGDYVPNNSWSSDYSHKDQVEFKGYNTDMGLFTVLATTVYLILIFFKKTRKYSVIIFFILALLLYLEYAEISYEIAKAARNFEGNTNNSFASAKSTIEAHGNLTFGPGMYIMILAWISAVSNSLFYFFSTRKRNNSNEHKTEFKNSLRKILSPVKEILGKINSLYRQYIYEKCKPLLSRYFEKINSLCSQYIYEKYNPLGFSIYDRLLSYDPIRVSVVNIAIMALIFSILYFSYTGNFSVFFLIKSTIFVIFHHLLISLLFGSLIKKYSVLDFISSFRKGLSLYVFSLFSLPVFFIGILLEELENSFYKNLTNISQYINICILLIIIMNIFIIFHKNNLPYKKIYQILLSLILIIFSYIWGTMCLLFLK